MEGTKSTHPFHLCPPEEGRSGKGKDFVSAVDNRGKQSGLEARLR